MPVPDTMRMKYGIGLPLKGDPGGFGSLVTSILAFTPLRPYSTQSPKNREQRIMHRLATAFLMRTPRKKSSACGFEFTQSITFCECHPKPRRRRGSSHNLYPLRNGNCVLSEACEVPQFCWG